MAITPGALSRPRHWTSEIRTPNFCRNCWASMTAISSIFMNDTCFVTRSVPHIHMARHPTAHLIVQTLVTTIIIIYFITITTIICIIERRTVAVKCHQCRWARRMNMKSSTIIIMAYRKWYGTSADGWGTSDDKARVTKARRNERRISEIEVRVWTAAPGISLIRRMSIARPLTESTKAYSGKVTQVNYKHKDKCVIDFVEQ